MTGIDFTADHWVAVQEEFTLVLECWRKALLTTDGTLKLTAMNGTRIAVQARDIRVLREFDDPPLEERVAKAVEGVKSATAV